MKTKVFVCSSSQIAEIKHNSSIEAIPFIYKFSDDEMFEDIVELSNDAIYNRLILDKNAHLELLSIGHERVSDYLKKAKEDGYDNAFFILPNRLTVNLGIPVNIALEENKEINVAMYQSNEISLPLAYMALIADKKFNDGASILETWNALVNYENISNIFIFTPQAKNDRISNFDKIFKHGKYSIYKGGKLMDTPDVKKNNALEVMLDEFIQEISGKEVIPFILSSDKTSKYNEIILNALNEYDLDLNQKAFDKIRIYSLPLYFGLKCGINSIAIGYVELKDGIILEKK